MFRNYFAAFILFLFPYAAIADATDLSAITPSQAGMKAEKLAEMNGLIWAAIAENKMPGCVVLVGRPHGIAWLKAYGKKRTEPEPEPMTDDTVFDLASITKPVATATCVMKLVEKGMLTVDDPVAKHIPEFAIEDKGEITLADLLVHRSGMIPDNDISDYQNGPLIAKQKLYALKPIAPLGSKFMYSDVNFMILGEVVARVSGEPLNEFACKQIFEPLQMAETMYQPSQPLRARTAPTEKRDGKWIQGDVHDPRAYLLGGVAGHAGVFSTARDLAKYATDALSGIEKDESRILKQSTWRAMIDPRTIKGTNNNNQPVEDTRGLGWDMRSRYSSNRGTKFSERAFGHGGFTGTVLWIDPENKLYVIFLSNRVHPNGKGLVNPLAGKICEIAVEAIEQ